MSLLWPVERNTSRWGGRIFYILLPLFPQKKVVCATRWEAKNFFFSPSLRHFFGREKINEKTPTTLFCTGFSANIFFGGPFSVDPQWKKFPPSTSLAVHSLRSSLLAKHVILFLTFARKFLTLVEKKWLDSQLDSLNELNWLGLIPRNSHSTD